MRQVDLSLETAARKHHHHREQSTHMTATKIPPSEDEHQ